MNTPALVERYVDLFWDAWLVFAKWFGGGSWWKWGLIGLKVVVISGALVWWLLPRYETVRVANLAVRSFSVAWVSDKPRKGCVVAVSMSLPMRFSRMCHEGAASNAHLVTFYRMEPETGYFLFGMEGILPSWKWPLRVMTLAEREEPPLEPRPGYGSVFDLDGNRKPGVLVYVYTMTNQAQYPVAVLTNESGNYAANMANLMRLGDSFVVEAIESNEVWARIESDSRYMTPFMPLILRRQE